jgi:hypothetical protein
MELIIGNFLVPGILVFIVLTGIFMVTFLRNIIHVLNIFFIAPLDGFINFLSDWEGIVIDNYVLDFIVIEVKLLNVDYVVKSLYCFN